MDKIPKFFIFPVRKYLSRNCFLNLKSQKILSKDSIDRIREGIAKNSKYKIVQRILLKDCSFYVQARLASNFFLKKEYQIYFANHPNKIIQECLFLNKHICESAKNILSKNPVPFST